MSYRIKDKVIIDSVTMEEFNNKEGEIMKIIPPFFQVKIGELLLLVKEFRLKKVVVVPPKKTLKEKYDEFVKNLEEGVSNG